MLRERASLICWAVHIRWEDGLISEAGQSRNDFRLPVALIRFSFPPGMADTFRQRIKQASGLDDLTPVEVAERLQHLPGLVFFDSSGHFPKSSSAPVSLIAARPRQIFRGSIFEPGERVQLQQALASSHPVGNDFGFPAGGLCGWVDYEGEFVFGEYPEMLVYHHGNRCWFELGGLSREMAEPQTVSAEIGSFREMLCRERYISAVERAKEWIAAGDIYQVNLAQGFETEVSGGTLLPFYQHLREQSPAPMSAWMSLAGREVLCSSPETFLRISGRGIETRPIKGTRPRHNDVDEDTRSSYELKTSPKEISELVMITDLLRNDIGQVCEFGSVEVTDLLRLESLEQVHHLVSTVKGTLREEIGAVNALAACFPGGSITGAPKKRAMEIIGELETGNRELYCGALGWLGYNGESVFNIAIRTLVRNGNHLSYQVGAGIVADSDPEKEYEETLQKAAGIRQALDAFGRECLLSD